MNRFKIAALYELQKNFYLQYSKHSFVLLTGAYTTLGKSELLVVQSNRACSCMCCIYIYNFIRTKV